MSVAKSENRVEFCADALLWKAEALARAIDETYGGRVNGPISRAMDGLLCAALDYREARAAAELPHALPFSETEAEPADEKCELCKWRRADASLSGRCGKCEAY